MALALTALARPSNSRLPFGFAAGALFVGAATYLVRPAPIGIFGWPLVSSPLGWARATAAPLRGVVPASVLGVLPDVAWAVALALILTRLRSTAGLAAGFCLCAGWEIGQGLGLVAGTFDLADLVTSSAAYVAVVFLSLFIQRKGASS
jgi:hypothetical protein